MNKSEQGELIVYGLSLPGTGDQAVQLLHPVVGVDVCVLETPHVDGPLGAVVVNPPGETLTGGRQSHGHGFADLFGLHQDLLLALGRGLNGLPLFDPHPPLQELQHMLFDIHETCRVDHPAGSGSATGCSAPWDAIYRSRHYNSPLRCGSRRPGNTLSQQKVCDQITASTTRVRFSIASVTAGCRPTSFKKTG